MNGELEQFTRRMFMTLGGAAALGTLGSGAPAEAAGMSDLDRKNIEVVKEIGRAHV